MAENRLSQEAVEALRSNADANARMSQAVAEALRNNADARAVLSQVVVEVLRTNSSGSSGATPGGGFSARWVW